MSARTSVTVWGASVDDVVIAHYGLERPTTHFVEIGDVDFHDHADDDITAVRNLRAVFERAAALLADREALLLDQQSEAVS